MIYMGYDKWKSKKGSTGYNLHFMEPAESGNREVMRYDAVAKAYRYNSCDEQHFMDLFKDMKYGTEIQELYRGNYSNVVGYRS